MYCCNILILYDKRKGWRGPLTNKINKNDWYKNLEEFELEKSINWELAIIKKIDQFAAKIETKKELNGLIENSSKTYD